MGAGIWTPLPLELGNSSSLPDILPRAVSNSSSALEDAGAYVLEKDVLASPLALPCFSSMLHEFQMHCPSYRVPEECLGMGPCT